jgi:RNA recognition motif-containing protein
MSYDTTEDDVKDHFSTYGTVLTIKMVKNDTNTGHKGSCFIKFDKEEPVD